MTNDTCLTVSQIGILLGLFFAAAGGFGAYWFGKQVDREKDRQIGDLLKQVEDTKSVALSVEKSVNPRKLSGQQTQAFVSALGAAKHATVVLHSVSGDPEAFRFAGLLREGLLSAGWRVRGIYRSAFMKPVPPLMIFVTVDLVPEYAGALQRSLEAAGLDVVVVKGLPVITELQRPEFDPDPSLGEVHLVVGKKAD